MEEYPLPLHEVGKVYSGLIIDMSVCGEGQIQNPIPASALNQRPTNAKKKKLRLTFHEHSNFMAPGRSPCSKEFNYREMH